MRLPVEATTHEVLVGECLGGALYVNDFLKLARAAGFAPPRMLVSEEVTVGEGELKALLGDARFYSVTFRCVVCVWFIRVHWGMRRRVLACWVLIAAATPGWGMLSLQDGACCHTRMGRAVYTLPTMPSHITPSLSNVCRLFKVPGSDMDDLPEDYGHTVTYKGSVPTQEAAYTLDNTFTFPAGAARHSMFMVAGLRSPRGGQWRIGGDVVAVQGPGTTLLVSYMCTTPRVQPSAFTVKR